MRKEYVKHYKRGFECDAASWLSFGAAFSDDHAPYPSSRAAVAEKVLSGRWREAYADWLKAGEFSREEEFFLGFILATEAVYHMRPSAKVLELPKRVWNHDEYTKCLRDYDDDEFWFEIDERLKIPGTTPWSRERNHFIRLLGEGRSREAEVFYYDRDWDHFWSAESDLALIHMCAFVLGDWEETEQMWFYADRLGRTRGPVRLHQIQRAFNSGRMPRTTPVYANGMRCWRTADQIIFSSSEPTTRGCER